MKTLTSKRHGGNTQVQIDDDEEVIAARYDPSGDHWIILVAKAAK
jgi:hypothetical protein